jgi:EmrB/QacA subfamily drug resistance transporter
MTFVDMTIVNIAFPSIRSSFPNTSLSTLSWVFNGYNVVFAAFLVPAGRLADSLGRRRLFQVGLGGFAVASAVCAAAPSAAVLIAGRLLQAAAAAILVPASLSLSLLSAPADRRATTFSSWTAAAAVGAGIGMPLGGLLVRTCGWPLIFVVNLPVAALALVLSQRLVPESRDESAGPLPDLAGAAVLALVLGALALGIVKVSDWGLTDARVVGCWSAAALLLAVFVRRCGRHPRPVFERDLLARPGFVSANVMSAIGAVGYFMYLLGNVLFLTGVWHYSALRAGFATFPSAVVAGLVARPAGRFADRSGHALPLLIGCVLWAAGCLLWAARMGNHPAYLGGFLPGQLLSGAGVGIAFPLVGTAAVASVPPIRLATGAGVNAAVRQIGAVLGIALAVSVVAQPSAVDPVAVFARLWESAAVLFLMVALAAPLVMRSVHTSVSSEMAGSWSPSPLSPPTRPPSARPRPAPLRHVRGGDAPVPSQATPQAPAAGGGLPMLATPWRTVATLDGCPHEIRGGRRYDERE